MLKLNKKWLVVLVVIGIVIVVGIVVAAFLGCSYRNHEFQSFIRLQIEAPDCQKAIPAGSTECCQCFLAFDGVRSQDAIQFIGSGLKHSYDAERRIFRVSREGEIKNAGNSVETRSGHVLVNGQQLPVRSTPLRVLVKEDGRLVNEFCDVN